MIAAADSKARYRQLRGAWGWSFAALWLLFWWLKLDTDRRTALAQPCPESLIYKAQDLVLGKGQACKGAIDGGFWGGMLLAILFTPLAFVIAHHFAKWRLDRIAAVQQTKTNRQEQERQQTHAAIVTGMGEKAKLDELQSRKSNDRYELITRLGAVDDQLIVLADETDTERTKLIKMTIMQSLRDIHAKFTDDELVALHTDDSIASRVARTLGEMRKLSLEDSRLYADLASMFDNMARADMARAEPKRKTLSS